jgi:hypothetical protein
MAWAFAVLSTIQMPPSQSRKHIHPPSYNLALTFRPTFFYIMRCIPISASQTKMEYEVYRANSASDEDFNEISDCFKQILKEDKDLCNAAQKNLNSGIFVNGELHPRVEKV